jgi:hypothetical protein
MATMQNSEVNYHGNWKLNPYLNLLVETIGKMD